MRNLQEQVKKAFCYQKFFWPFIVWINCSSDLKNFVNSWPSTSNFKSFSCSLEQFFLTVGQNNFGNKIPFLNEGHVNWKSYFLHMQYLKPYFCGHRALGTMSKLYAFYFLMQLKVPLSKFDIKLHTRFLNSSQPANNFSPTNFLINDLFVY